MYNNGRYNLITLERDPAFLPLLQDLVADIGLVKIKREEYEVDGKSHDITTYYTLFWENAKKDYELQRSTLEDLNGRIVRYYIKDLEFLLIFFPDQITFIFYCNTKTRKKTIKVFLKYFYWK